MRRARRALARIFLFLLVAALLAPETVPPFLDRIYYRGPKSDHFDGQRFFNPDRRGAGARGAREHSRRVAGAAMHVTWVGQSTVLVQTAGLNILTDPAWSERASPFSFIGPRRVRALEPGQGWDLPPLDRGSASGLLALGVARAGR